MARRLKEAPTMDTYELRNGEKLANGKLNPVRRMTEQDAVDNNRRLQMAGSPYRWFKKLDDHAS